jgi:hypothetical protein
MIKNNEDLAAWLRQAAEDPDVVEAARLRIEDVAIEMRDMSAFVIRANGIVCRDYDQTPSSMIRISTPGTVILALKAIADHLDGG